MKLYRVPLYQCNYIEEDSSDNIIYFELRYVDDIIAKKRMFKATDLITGYKNIDVKKANFNEYNFVSRIKKPKKKSLITFEEDFNELTVANSRDIDYCLEHYEESNWKQLYDKLTKKKEKVYTKKQEYL